MLPSRHRAPQLAPCAAMGGSCRDQRAARVIRRGYRRCWRYRPRRSRSQEAAWGAEFKWDGVRAVAYVSAGELRLLSRSGRDMTRAYPELADSAARPRPRDMVLDGEIAAFTGGRPSFAALQRRMRVGAPTGGLVAAVPVTYLVFDIMYSGGQPLITEPYAQRRAILEAQPLAGPHVHVPPSFPGGGKAVLAVSVRDGLGGGRGSSTPDSPYQPGRRSPNWLKIKNRRLLDVVVGSLSPGRGHRAGQIGSLLVGMPGRAGLAYAGRVGTGFTQPELIALEKVLAPLRRESPPFSGRVPPAQARNVTWVEPRLVIEVSYAEQTQDGILRAAAYQGIKATRDGHGHRALTRRVSLLSGLAGASRPCRLPPGPAGQGSRLPRGRAHRCRRPRNRGVSAALFGAELIGPAPAARSRARLRPARARPRLGIACHVNLPHGLPFQILPRCRARGHGPADTSQQKRASRNGPAAARPHPARPFQPAAIA